MNRVHLLLLSLCLASLASVVRADELRLVGLVFGPRDYAVLETAHTPAVFAPVGKIVARHYTVIEIHSDYVVLQRDDTGKLLRLRLLGTAPLPAEPAPQPIAQPTPAPLKDKPAATSRRG